MKERSVGSYGNATGDRGLGLISTFYLSMFTHQEHVTLEYAGTIRDRR